MRFPPSALGWMTAAAWLLGSSPLSAQSLWLDPRVRQGVSFEIARPSFNGGNTSTLTTAMYLSFRAAAGSQVTITGELPFAHAGGEGFESQTGLGNIYAGLGVEVPNSRVGFEFGARLPLADEDNDGPNAVGLFSDAGRWEAFLPNVAAIIGQVRYRYTQPSGFTVQLRAGPSAWISTGDQDSELLAVYSALFGYEVPEVSLTGGLVGRAVLTESGSFGERTVHELGAAISLGSQRVRPGLQIRVPWLDKDWNELLNYVVALHVSIAMP